MKTLYNNTAMIVVFVWASNAYGEEYIPGTKFNEAIPTA